MAQVLLVAAIVALGSAVFMTATGGLGRLVGALGTGLGKVVDDLTATASPRPTQLIVSDAPLLAEPSEPSTNETLVDLVVTVPSDVVGRDDTSVRIYLTLTGQRPAPIDEVPVRATPQFLVPVELTEGPNTFTATLIGPGGESEPSPVVTWILDTAPPDITIVTPKDGATVNRQAVEVEGTTQAGTTVIARNEANNASATSVAAEDGTFAFALPIAEGTNGIALTATDPAGNAAETVLTVRRGSGKLAATLTVSPSRLSIAELPQAVTLTVAVTDPDGRPLEGATVAFQLALNGLRVIADELVTGGDGQAVFRTTVPTGAIGPDGLATVFVQTEEFGTLRVRAVVRVVD